MSDTFATAPLPLPPNQPPRPYRGGAGIVALRRLDPTAPHRPEDFLASTTEIHSGGGVGLTVLADGRPLREHIRADPTGWLGPAHVAAYGPSSELLVKLLDTGERLFVHFHPDASFAVRHLDCAHGKTEGWVITAAEPGARVYLGHRREVSREQVRDWVQGQRTDELLGALHEIPVSPGQSFLVPAGTPHAIGPGVTAVELQEPSDLSIILEWTGFDLDPADAYLGLSLATALQALDVTAWDADRLASVRRVLGESDDPVTPIFPATADPFFRGDWLRVRGSLATEAGFAILVVTSGSGSLLSAAGRFPVAAGACVLLPHGAGPVTFTGSLDAIRCRPPAPR
jgi:mannose-6-phosphate isomerase